MRNKILALCLVLVLMIVVYGFYTAPPKLRTLESEYPADVKIRKTMADWANIYVNVKSMADDSDLIVVCEVQSSIVYREKVSGYTSPQQYLVLTNHTVHIQRTLKGESPDDTILVRQIGGLYDMKLHMFDDFPILPEKKLVLFLEDSGIGFYYVNGPQGHFRVINNRVYSVGEIYDDDEIQMTTQRVHTKGISIKQLSKQIE